MLQIGSLVDGKYKILSKIGQGGMSTVYLAINERANKTWAIKELRKDGGKEFSAVKQRLVLETNILKNLSHKHLPSIVDVIDDGEVFLIVMDYIEGKSLKDVLAESMEEKGHPIYVEDVIRWGTQLCDVLQYLHTRPQPIIYRDMKPANVMLKPDGEISLIDFGAARFFKRENSQDTICLGTPGYAAPEQYGGSGQTTPQTDIYGLGATLHHLITGKNPAVTPFSFPGITHCCPTLLQETPKELHNMLLGLEQIINRCTQYEALDRYQSCAVMKYDLEHTKELTLPYRKKLRRKMGSFMGCLGGAVMLGGISLLGKIMEHKMQTSGYEYYMESAQTASVEEKVGYYKKAVALNPSRTEAYLKLLDTMMADDDFSVPDDVLMTMVLNSRDNGRKYSNQDYLKTNPGGYVEFSYQMGMAYYYSVGNNGDKSSAAGWFQNVADADMEELDMGENNQYKDAWKARAMILGRISGYYKNKIGVTNKAGDAEVSYKDYWDDLMALFHGEIAGKDNEITELRLYNEIVYQIYSHTIEFRDEAGITQDVMEQVLGDIAVRIQLMNRNRNRQGEQLKASIDANIYRARNNIKAAYAAEDAVDPFNWKGKEE